MTDRLGYRLKIGIIIPSTNTTVQPETDAMRPAGVTNHIGRIHIPDLPLTNDTEFEAMVEAIGPDLFGAVDRVMTCKPDHLVMAMSIPTFWGGKAGGDELLARLEARAGVPVSMGSAACVEALRRFAHVRRIGILTPYQPVGDAHVARYFADHGYEVSKVVSLMRPSEVQIAHATETDIREGLKTLAASGVDAIVQAGTDLAVTDIADEAERWLGLPVIAINAATYWRALRHAGIADQIPGRGVLLASH
ncbi:aspartate/glutamate racemase family protein [Xanthobacter dioxanivorans]|uniref:Aspartate/glutamate racemase family protein n=1 Tax=Xanthobacter dioxanivorans TaxID=2528964 RepID=A0A974PPC8_9HYPH|nr:aspartate/glutamate racemase family protein [Xanthobacter dioxanivorans]QRG07302.1 aspartate/glutamate racemase family protein [Xanthobacter dioxanivorans]